MSKINLNASKLIDKYISNSPDYFRTSMYDLRNIIISSDNRISEDWKWEVPNFHYKGVLCWLAYFKTHIGINFFKGALINDSYNVFDQTNAEVKGNRIIKIKSQKDINANAIKNYLRDAIELNEKGIKPQSSKNEVEVPDYFVNALKTNEKALKVFESFSRSYKKDYVEWIVKARRIETRENRIKQALEWIAEGKDRNWKYKS